MANKPCLQGKIQFLSPRPPSTLIFQGCLPKFIPKGFLDCIYCFLEPAMFKFLIKLPIRNLFTYVTTSFPFLWPIREHLTRTLKITSIFLLVTITGFQDVKHYSRHSPKASRSSFFLLIIQAFFFQLQIYPWKLFCRLEAHHSQHLEVNIEQIPAVDSSWDCHTSHVYDIVRVL